MTQVQKDEAVELMTTLNNKYKAERLAYNIDAVMSLDEYLYAHVHILEHEEIMTIKELLNQ